MILSYYGIQEHFKRFIQKYKEKSDNQICKEYNYRKKIRGKSFEKLKEIGEGANYLKKSVVTDRRENLKEEKKDKREKKDSGENLILSGVAGSSYDTINKYGSAAKEHLVALYGHDRENHIELKKSLKSVQSQKSNPENAYSIQQQKAGWGAEIKDTANENAKNIIEGKSIRKIRHDDLPNTAANDQLYDHVKIDAEGNIIEGSGSQMKFIGSSKLDPSGNENAKRALAQLKSKKFQKYIDNDVTIEVPKDEYAKMMDLASDQLNSLQKQLEIAKKRGNLEAVEKIEKNIQDLKTIKKNLKPSSLTRKEARESVINPEISTAKSIAKVSHSAGVKTAQNAALISGSVSLVKNVVDLCKGEVEADEAIVNVAKDTAESAVIGYGTGFAGTAVKSIMQNSSSQYLRVLSKTNVAGTIVAVAVSASRTINKYFKGEIDGTECLENLGEQGTGMVASSMFAVIGQTIIPIPVVGGLVGGMIGYALSSATYGILLTSLKEAKLAYEERIEIEKVCEEHIKMMREYRAQINKIIEQYLTENMEIFNESFSGIKEALAIGDVDLLIENANTVTESVGGTKPFETMEEFNKKMLLGETFKL